VAARGSHFQRASGTFLSLDVGEIGQVVCRDMDARLGARQNLRAAEMVGDGDQAARRQNVDIRASPSRLGSSGVRAD